MLFDIFISVSLRCFIIIVIVWPGIARFLQVEKSLGFVIISHFSLKISRENGVTRSLVYTIVHKIVQRILHRLVRAFRNDVILLEGGTIRHLCDINDFSYVYYMLVEFVWQEGWWVFKNGHFCVTSFMNTSCSS